MEVAPSWGSNSACAILFLISLSIIKFISVSLGFDDTLTFLLNFGYNCGMSTDWCFLGCSELNLDFEFPLLISGDCTCIGVWAVLVSIDSFCTDDLTVLSIVGSRSPFIYMSFIYGETVPDCAILSVLFWEPLDNLGLGTPELVKPSLEATSST